MKTKLTTRAEIETTICHLRICSEKLNQEKDIDERIKVLSEHIKVVEQDIKNAKFRLETQQAKIRDLSSQELSISRLLSATKKELDQCTERIRIANHDLVKTLEMPGQNTLAKVQESIRLHVPENLRSKIQAVLVSDMDATLMGIMSEWTIETPEGLVAIQRCVPLRPGFSIVILRDGIKDIPPKR